MLKPPPAILAALNAQVADICDVPKTVKRWGFYHTDLRTGTPEEGEWCGGFSTKGEAATESAAYPDWYTVSDVCERDEPNVRPNYCEDLNAMALAEEVMIAQDCYRYQDELANILGDWEPETRAHTWIWHAPAWVRAVAFDRVQSAVAICPRLSSPKWPCV